MTRYPASASVFSCLERRDVEIARLSSSALNSSSAAVAIAAVIRRRVGKWISSSNCGWMGSHFYSRSYLS